MILSIWMKRIIFVSNKVLSKTFCDIKNISEYYKIRNHRAWMVKIGKSNKHYPFKFGS